MAYPAICLDGVKENMKVFMVSGITAEIQSGYPGVFHRHYRDVLLFSFLTRQLLYFH